MAVNVVLNGVSYSIPDPGDSGWGQDLTDYLVAQASGLLQKAGGSFTLTAEVDFGATYGLKSTYFKSRATNPASAGQVRLGNAESVSWRNNANSANLALSVNASDELTFNGNPIQGGIAVSDTSTIDLTFASDTLSADIVTGSITNALISNSAAIAYSKLALTGSIVDADISASAAIAYSKLALTGSIVNADISASAAIAFSKLASLTSANILVGNGSNVAAAVAVTGDISLSNAGVTAYAGTVPLNKGGTGQTTKAAAFDALSPMSASGDIIYGGASGTGTRLAKGSDGQVLTLASGVPSWANSGAPTAPKVTTYTSGTGTFSKTGSPLYLRVRMVGGGGGGAGGGSGSPGNGGNGGTTTFGTTLLSASGGSGASGAVGGGGGVGSLGTGPTGTALNGSRGQGGSTATGALQAGGSGSSTPFGNSGGGGSGSGPTAGSGGSSNSGSGGGGGATATASGFSGGGGGAAGFVDAIITSPSSTYSYAVGSAGAGGAAGTSGSAGGDGGSGYIEVTEYYQ